MKYMNTIPALLLMFTATAWSASGKAVIKGTTENSDISGVVKLNDTKEGLHIHASLSNVPPGDHGFHIHTYGTCANNGRDAGGHFNPRNKPHGHVIKDGLRKAHVGDLGNITINEDGSGTLEVKIKGVHLAKGKSAVAGRAFILHSKPDDFGQPTGNAGSRIGCGSIVLTKD